MHLPPGKIQVLPYKCDKKLFNQLQQFPNVSIGGSVHHFPLKEKEIFATAAFWLDKSMPLDVHSDAALCAIIGHYCL